MKRRSFFLGLSALLAGVWLPGRAKAAMPFGLRPVAGINLFCTCPTGGVRMVAVANDPHLWFEVMGKHEAECGVNRMVKHWEKRGYYLIPPCPQGTKLYIGDPVVEIG